MFDFFFSSDNHHKGWPKFIGNMYAQNGDGVVVLLFGPSVLSTTLSGNNNVIVTQATNYPFSGNVTLQIKSQASFQLFIRFPGEVHLKIIDLFIIDIFILQVG